VEGLRVTGRTSSFAMKGRVDDLPTIARRLGVAHLIEGSVRKAGVRVRITARLVEAAGGTQLWSQAFGGDLGDVFEVQERIARAVAAALEVRLLGSGRTEGRTRVPEAHDQYLLGISAFARGSNEGEVRAVAAFRRAVELDPGYAPAWARLATALYRASGDASQNPAVGFPAAEAAAEKAIALAPDLADGWAARAELRQAIRYDWAGARADYERARALEPGASATLFRYGSLLLALGRTAEAISALREATALDPLSAEVATDLAMAYLQDGQLARAEATAERALELSPEHARAARTLGFALLLQGQLPGAQRAFRRSSHGFFVLMGDAMVEHSLGHPAESERAVAGLLGWPEAENGAWQIAQVHAWRGEPDQAFEWLRAAVRLRDPGLDQLKGDPVLRPLHGDPRFAEVLRAVNLPG
jgi:serine/threonine-protein kinase